MPTLKSGALGLFGSLELHGRRRGNFFLCTAACGLSMFEFRAGTMQLHFVNLLLSFGTAALERVVPVDRAQSIAALTGTVNVRTKEIDVRRVLGVGWKPGSACSFL
jgi:hypothetical protein